MKLDVTCEMSLMFPGGISRTNGESERRPSRGAFFVPEFLYGWHSIKDGFVSA